LTLEGIPKILAMILNNEKVYNTSEKSARYTKMNPSKEEKELYEKWINIYKEKISVEYPKIDEKRVEKLAQENARYLISIFTPATIMGYTVNFCQLNYIVHWFEDYIKKEDCLKSP
jgi:thiaminase